MMSYSSIPGRNTFRQSIDTSVGSQIAQRVVNDAMQTDFDVLIGGDQPPPIRDLVPRRYFDDQGNELPEAKAADSVYHVQIVVLTSTPIPGSGSPMVDLATLVIQVANNPGRRELQSDAQKLWISQPGVPISRYSALIARNR